MNLSLDGVKPENCRVMNCNDCKCIKIVDGFYFHIEACKVHEPILSEVQNGNTFEYPTELHIQQ